MTDSLKKTLWTLIVFQIIFWTMVPLLAHHAPPLDATEMYSWSLSFEWGYYKHPPMPAWIVGILQMLIGKNMLSLFLPASLSIAASYYCVAWLASRMLPEKSAIIALLLYALVIYCHLWSTDFNHNQIQMPFWALSLVFLYMTLERGSLTYSFFLGVVMGLNALSKYTAALIVPCALLLLMVSPDWRRTFNLKMIAFATLGFLIIFSPHIYWLFQNDFLPFRYLGGRFDQLSTESNPYLSLIDYILNICVAHALMILLALVVLIKPRSQENSSIKITQAHRDFIWIMGFGPVLITLLMGIFGVQLYSRWVTPMLPMISIWFVYLLGTRLDGLYSKKGLALFIVIELILGTVYIYKNKFNESQSSRGHFPAPEISAQIYNQWHQLYPQAPFKIVSGSEWEASFVSFFSPEKTYAYTEADSKLAPWVSLTDVNACGMVMMSPTSAQLKQFPQAQIQQPIKISTKNNQASVNVSWALLPPAGICQLK